MIAPDPALAGPRPAAASREAVRSAEPERHVEGAFDIVLQAVEDEADPAAPAAGEPPVPEAVAPPASDPAMALAAMLPAVPAAPADAAPSAAAPAPAVAAQGPVAVLAASGAPVRATGGGGREAEVPPPETADEAREASSRPDVEAMPSAVPLRRTPAPGAPLFAAAVEMPREVSDAPPVPAEAAARAEAAVPPPARPAAVAPAPIEGDRAVEGVSLKDAAPPAWHLAPDRGSGSARPEAAAQASTQPPAAVSPQAVAGQVAVAIGRASDDRVEIRLDPPELGRVQIHLTRHDGAIQAVVLADRPETQDLLRRHAEVLARELGEAGYDNVSLAFGGGEAQARRDEAPGIDWAEAWPVQAAAPEAAPPAPALRRPAAGLLDVRL